MAEEKLVKVYLIKAGNKVEAVSASHLAKAEDCLVGILEAEPKQDFGCHKGDPIEFMEYVDEKGEAALVADFNIKMTFTPEELEGGEKLLASIHKFYESKAQNDLFEIMMLLRDSNMWISCIVDDETTTVPDTLVKDGKFFIPAFTEEKEMGKFGEQFTNVKKSVIDIIEIAKKDDKEISGIVINPFSFPFVVDKGLFETIGKLESRLKK